MEQKLFVLSMDAMVHEDIAYLMTKPNFRRLFEKRAEVERVRSVFPSVTYPAHTTLMTGCLPGTHGIYNNVPFKDYEDHIKHWYLNSKAIRVEDLFAAAKRAGCTTASVYWPITGNNPNVDHIINEYFFYYPEEGTLEAFRKMGADEVAIAAVEENRALIEAKRRKEVGTAYDAFIMGCTCSLIRNVKPDLMMVHNCVIDSARHKYGVFSEGTTKALDKTEEWLGDVIRAMEDAGTFENTNFVVLSDHGQLDYNRRIRMNVLLAQGGFVDVAPDGTVYDWRAFAHVDGMTASIYLRDPGNKKEYEAVYAYLKQLTDSGKYGFTHVYTTEETRQKYGTWGAFSFMVTTDGQTSISGAWTDEAVELLGADEQKPVAATHGYEPEMGPQPVFLGRGPAFREGAVLPRAGLEDVAPTLAAILGQTMPQAEGRCLRELLK